MSTVESRLSTLALLAWLLLTKLAVAASSHGAHLTTSEVALIVPILSAAASVAGARLLDRRRPRRPTSIEHLRRERDRYQELIDRMEGGSTP